MVVISSILIIVCLVFIVNKWIGHNRGTMLKETEQVETIPTAIITSEIDNRIDESEIYELIHSSSKLKTEDWSRIELFINQSQNNFAQNLRQDYASLSEDDIHVVLLIRMGLDNKEIASSCNVLPSSFRTRRSRLKKKDERRMRFHIYVYKNALQKQTDEDSLIKACTKRRQITIYTIYTR